ncbi:hypothetical protein IDM40_03540 [Nocardiopsis sp. HNM0947]|uniref:Uncharacterized protein n=1 Tax=Nocardiopsis coralli TaxID=2772213 RepID=A0ABR9P200_9ACTN|nr:hypothetical protein [Nocardiopsis coralli]MBE2997785.1 hypothetical protein [Nocardiopsis coralli]
MADAGRTAHAPRVVTAVRPAAAAVLFPLLAAGFLAVLWFLGGAPAHALDLSGATGGSGSGALGAATGDGEADGDRRDTDGSGDTGLGSSALGSGTGLGNGGSVEPGPEVLGSGPAAPELSDSGTPGSDHPRSGTHEPHDPEPDGFDADCSGGGPSDTGSAHHGGRGTDGCGSAPDSTHGTGSDESGQHSATDGSDDDTTGKVTGALEDESTDRADQSTHGITEEVTAPVTETLGSVHQRLSDPDHTPDSGGLSDAGLTVAEVGEGARRVVEGLEHTAERGSAPGTDLASALTGQGLLAPDGLTNRPTATAPGDTTGEHGDSDGRDRDADGAARTAQDTDHGITGFPTGSETVPASVYGDATAQGDSAADPEPRAAGDDPRPSHLSSAPNTSAQTTGAAAPGVAGYLTSSPVAGPASTAVRAWSDAPHGMPSDPADDPTVSPD